ncbi:MAG: putative rane protein [Firmicutes bacterium]|nr:putative rane protein [Bacillota bacterium]
MMHGRGLVMRGFDHGFMMNGYHGWLPMAFHLLILVGIIILAVILLRRHATKAKKNQRLNDPALLILRERYAQGQIDTEEYNSRKRDLSI